MDNYKYYQKLYICIYTYICISAYMYVYIHIPTPNIFPKLQTTFLTTVRSTNLIISSLILNLGV